MLDYISTKSNSTQCLKEKIKSSLKSEMTTKVARRASFFSLASVLGACNFGGGSDSVAPLNISAIKGPLSGALAFVDRDGDGVFDEGEEFAVTSSSGAATITPTSAVAATQKLVITSISAGQTIGGTTYETATVDTNTGGTVEDLVLKAPSNSTVVTPVTTLVAETGLSETQVKEVLGLPAEMDVLNFNPFSETLTEAEKTVALEAEKVALKVYTTVSTIQASAKSSGLDATKAFATAIEAVGDVVKEQSAAGTTADLADSSIIDKVVKQTETVLTAKLEEAGFDAAAVTAAVDANKAVLATAKAQIKTVNDAADAIKSFDAAELGAIAKLAVKSGEEAAAAVTAEKAAPGSGAAKFSMKTAEAVATAKETAKAEVEVAQAAAKAEEETKTETTTTTSSSSSADTKNFVLTEGGTVDWTITKGGGATAHASIDSSTSPDASYTVSGSTMIVDLGQSFTLKTVQDLLTDQSDLAISLSLASLPTKDDATKNTTTVTITEYASGAFSGTPESGEGQIRASVKSTFEATSSTQTDFKFDDGDPITIGYTPRSGDADVNISINNPSVNAYAVKNDGAFGSVVQSTLDILATKFFTALDAYDSSSAWTKTNILSKFVTSNSKGVYLSVDTSDLGLYSGSTKINQVDTKLSIGDNLPTAIVVSGSPRYSSTSSANSTLTVTAPTDKDGMGTITYGWERSADNSSWSTIGGATSTTYALQAADVGKYVRATASFTDKQNVAYTGGNKLTSNAAKNSDGTEVKVTQNADPAGTFTMYGGNHVGGTLTAVAGPYDANLDGDTDDTNEGGITDGDGITNLATQVKYHWEKSVDNGSSWTDLSGSAGTASTSNNTYTIAADQVANKLTLFRAVAEYVDDYGKTETVASAATAKVAKPHIYLQKIGSSTSSKIEIGVFLDDELLTTDAFKKYKTAQIEITPKETWATNFDSVANAYTDGNGDPQNSYFHDGSGGEVVMDDNFTKNQKLGSETITVWGTGSFNPMVTTLDGSGGKVKISPSFTKSGTYNIKTKHTTSELAANDIQLASFFLDPDDTLQATGKKIVEWDIGATNTFYGYNNGGAARDMGLDSAYLVDPYTFSFIL